ncbi:unnamed protein product [Adineta steineri]|uniref:Nucleosome assembly protein n=1 Tax=Adineta steineri TaxID=433720 RepID=A0A813XGV1_9BILA|nr:unnamed protein product [Adineta steineri]
MLSSSEELISTSSDNSSLSLNHADQLEFFCNNHFVPTTINDNQCIDILKDLQISYNQLESQYLKSVHELEYKFQEKCSYLFEKRSDIINGKYEPSDDECQLKTDFLETNDTQLSNTEFGIPSFWLQTLKQVPMIADLIKEWDEPLLKCLYNIKVQLHIEPITGFTLEFYFNEQSKNYFTNDILTKFYEIQIEPDKEVLSYEGTAIIRSIGCQINWIDTKTNVTKNSKTGELQSSFFHFFTSTTINDDWQLATDFQIGHYIRENIIPKAILYYTGEIFDEYEYDDDDDGNINEQQISLIEQVGEGEHL